MTPKSKLYIKKDVTFENVTLGATMERANTPFRIFANGHRLTFKNVNTVGHTSAVAPTIYTGQVSNGDGTGMHGVVVFENSNANTRVAGFFGGNQGLGASSQAESDIPATIDLDSGVRVDGPIDLGPNSSQVVLKVATPHFKTIDATEAANNTVTISTTERLAPIVMKNIKDLNLGAGVTLRPDVKNISSIDDDDLVERSTITGNINVAQGAVLDLTVLMHDPKTLALPTTNISGTGKVLIPSGGSSLTLAGANGVTFEIQNVGDNNHVVAGHQYILPRATSYTLSAKNPEEGITYDNGQAVAQQTPPPAPQKTLSLEIFKVTDKATAAISVDIDPFNDKAPEEFLAEVKAELQKKPELARFIVLKGGEHKPVRDVTERKDTIKWYIQEAGKVVITGDPAGSKDVPFDVAWNEAGTEQVVTYTLGTPPQTHVYKNTGVIVANPTAPVTVPQAHFFSSIPVTLEPRTSTLAVVPEEDPTRTLMAVDEAA